MGIAVSGEFGVLAAPERLDFTWRWDGDPDVTLVTIRLGPAGAGTELVLTHAGFGTDEGRDNHVQGWSDCLGRLVSRLAAG